MNALDSLLKTWKPTESLQGMTPAMLPEGTDQDKERRTHIMAEAVDHANRTLEVLKSLPGDVTIPYTQFQADDDLIAEWGEDLAQDERGQSVGLYLRQVRMLAAIHQSECDPTHQVKRYLALAAIIDAPIECQPPGKAMADSEYFQVEYQEARNAVAKIIRDNELELPQ